MIVRHVNVYCNACYSRLKNMKTNTKYRFMEDSIHPEKPIMCIHDKVQVCLLVLREPRIKERRHPHKTSLLEIFKT